MPSCSVPNCKNRSEHGFRVFQIPRGKNNQEKTKAWMKFINLEDLSKRATICEVHFEENQFESRRADGRKLLKWNAVPTIGGCEYQSPPPPKKKRTDESYDPTNELGQCSTIPADVDTFVENKEYVNIIQFQQSKSELKSALRKITALEKRIREMEERYKSIFNDDQAKFLRNGSHGVEEWSDDTVNKALKLYIACGAEGYEEIRRQNLPYPSIKINTSTECDI